MSDLSAVYVAAGTRHYHFAPGCPIIGRYHPARDVVVVTVERALRVGTWPCLHCAADLCELGYGSMTSER